MPGGGVGRTRVKVCCLASSDEVRAATASGADALGFLGAMPDGVGMPDAVIAALIGQVPPPVAAVLLTGETTATAIARQVRDTRAMAVQIVRPLDPEQVAELAALEPLVRRIQVIHVEGPQALDLIGPYAPHVDAFLLDSGRPSAAVPSYGGTGQPHDWDISAAFVAASSRPVFLAGGLNASNVRDAIGHVRPFGLDLFSGVRTRGVLDLDKLAAFMIAVRDADLARR